jgi:hypothetical protein
MPYAWVACGKATSTPTDEAPYGIGSVNELKVCGGCDGGGASAVSDPTPWLKGVKRSLFRPLRETAVAPSRV